MSGIEKDDIVQYRYRGKSHLGKVTGFTEVSRRSGESLTRALVVNGNRVVFLDEVQGIRKGKVVKDGDPDSLQ